MHVLRRVVLPILHACAVLVVLGQALGPAASVLHAAGHCSGDRAHAGHAAMHASGPAVLAAPATPAQSCAHCPAAECAIVTHCPGAGVTALAASVPIVRVVASAHAALSDVTLDLRSLPLTPPTPPPLLAS